MLAGAAGGIGAIFRAPLGGAIFAGEVLYIDHGHGVGGAPALPGQLDRGLLDVRPVHHPQADLRRPRPRLPRPARPAPVRPPGRASARRSAGSTCGSSTACATASSSRLPIPRHVKPALGRPAARADRPGVPRGDDRRLRLGAVGGDRHAARRWRCRASRSSCPHMGMRHAPDPGPAEDRRHGPDDQLGGERRRLRPVGLHRRDARRGASASSSRPASRLATIDPAAFALVGMGGFFAGVSKTPADLDRDGLRDDRLVQPARPLDARLRPEHRPLAALDALRGAGRPARSTAPRTRGTSSSTCWSGSGSARSAIRTEGLELVPEATPFAEIVRRVADSSETLFPVVDAEGRLTGIFTLRDIRLALLRLRLGPARPGRRPGHPPRAHRHPARRPAHRPEAADRAERRRDPRRRPRRPDPPDRPADRRELVSAYTAQIESLRRPGPPAGGSDGRASSEADAKTRPVPEMLARLASRADPRSPTRERTPSIAPRSPRSGGRPGGRKARSGGGGASPGSIVIGVVEGEARPHPAVVADVERRRVVGVRGVVEQGNPLGGLAGDRAGVVDPARPLAEDAVRACSSTFPSELRIVPPPSLTPIVLAIRTPTRPNGGLAERDRLLRGLELQVEDQEPLAVRQRAGRSSAALFGRSSVALADPGIRRRRSRPRRRRRRSGRCDGGRSGPGPRSSQKTSPLTSWWETQTELWWLCATGSCGWPIRVSERPEGPLIGNRNGRRRVGPKW